MAAVPDTPGLDVVDLWQVRAADVGELLEQEVREWRDELEWDFRASADLVRRFLEARALSGYALDAAGETVGYSYFVCEDSKGVIGNLYVQKGHRTPENEALLLGAVVGRLVRTRHVHRIESQLMLAQVPHGRPLPSARYAHSYPRNFMLADVAGAYKLAPRAFETLVFEKWTERRQEDAAHLIAAAYRSHVDSEINDQYRSTAGARRFLYNIIQYPGCGTFFAPASWVALARDTGRMVAMVLASMVADGTGHITQVCVSPPLKGRGVGYEVMRRSMCSMAEAGCRRVSLTVTAANENAVRLYERMGFATLRQFPALVWEGF